MFARAATAYRQVDLTSAPKPEIVARLFGRCLDDLAVARTAIASRDLAAKATSIDHATQIVVELRAALDHSVAPELAANLDALYRFVQDQLSTANLKLTLPPLDAAIRVMRELGDAFATIRRQP